MTVIQCTFIFCNTTNYYYCYYYGIIIVVVAVVIITIIIIIVVIIISSSITIIIIITCEAEDVSIGSSEEGELNQNGIKSIIWQFQMVRQFKTGWLACSMHSDSKGPAKVKKARKNRENAGESHSLRSECLE